MSDPVPEAPDAILTVEQVEWYRESLAADSLATSHEALRAEVERLRTERGRAERECSEWIADAQTERTRAEAAEARVADLAEALREWVEAEDAVDEACRADPFTFRAVLAASGRVDAAKKKLRAATHALLAGVSETTPARCPTCGSDNPKVRAMRGSFTQRSGNASDVWECRDAWHGAGVSERKEGT